MMTHRTSCFAALATAALFSVQLSTPRQVFAIPIDVTLQNATATLSQGGFDITAAIDGTLSGANGWANSGGIASPQTAVFQTPDTFVNGGTLTFSLIFDSPFLGHKLQKIRLSTTTDPNPTALGGNTWTELTPSLAETSNVGSSAVINGDNTIDFIGDALPDIYTISVPILTPDFTGFRLETLLGPNSRLGFTTGGGNGNYVLSEFQVSLDAVPEPSTFTLFALGLIGAAVRRQRHRRLVSGVATSSEAVHFRKLPFALATMLIAFVSVGTVEAAPVTLQNATSLYEQSGFTRDLTIDGNLGTGMAFNGSDFIDVITWETQADTSGGGTFTFTINQNFGSSHNLKRFRLAATDADRSLFSNNVGTNGDVVPSPGSFTLLRPISAVSAGGATLTITPDGYITATGTNPATDTYTITAASPLNKVTGFRMELQPQQEGSYGPGRAVANGNAVFSEFGVDFAGTGGNAASGGLKQIVLQNATATFAQGGFAASEAIDGILNDAANNGWAVAGGANSNQTAVFQTTGAVGADSLLFDLAFNNSFADHKMQRFRLSFTTEDNPDTLTTNWTEITPSFLDTSRTDSDASILSGNIIEITGSGAVTDFISVGANVPHTVGITGFRLEALLDGGQLGFAGNFVLTEFSAYAASVPEPSTLVLLGMGLVGLVARRRRGVANSRIAVATLTALTASLFASNADAVSITLQAPTATFSQGFGGQVAATIDGTLSGGGNGWAMDGGQAVNQTGVWETVSDLGLLGPAGNDVTFNLHQGFGSSHTIRKFRISATTADRSLFADGAANGGDVDASPGTWFELTPTSATATNGAVLTINGDNSIDATTSASSIYTVTAHSNLQDITGFRLELLTSGGVLGWAANNNLVLSEFTVDAVGVTPEPSTGLLLVAGLIGMASRRRLRK